MGQLAEDIVEGRCCALHMSYFEQEHGYSVVYRDCWGDMTPQERKETTYQKAQHKVL